MSVRSCSVEGADADGVLWRSVYAGERGELYRGDVLVCTCDEPDWTNVCSNGVPTCPAWRYFDYTNVTTIPEP